MTRAFDPLILLLCLAIGLVAAIAAGMVMAVRGRNVRESLPWIGEIAALTTAGAFLSRAFLSILLSFSGDQVLAAGVIWHLFLGAPALVADAVALVAGADTAFAPGPLLLAGLVFGALIGFFDGLYRIRDWRGWGPPTFLLDTTWGLALSVHGVVMLLYNAAFGNYAGNPRENEHLYDTGFCVKKGFAFTQGAVISNWQSRSADLLAHERIHVLQSRVFGPFFLFFYAFWLVVYGFVGLVVDIVGGLTNLQVIGEYRTDGGPRGTRRIALGDAAMWFGYYDNPWEVWAYRHGGWRDGDQVKLLRWPDLAVIVVTVLTLVPAALLFLWLVRPVFAA